jgi:hypothetical protein
VARSASFQRSPRLRELLLYICERAIQNRPQDLREQQIGCGVFGRKPEYNPGEDNIVRVERESTGWPNLINTCGDWQARARMVQQRQDPL